jgi:hypothetical protein
MDVHLVRVEAVDAIMFLLQADDDNNLTHVEHVPKEIKER